MTRLADALAATRPDWGTLPESLVRAFQWMEEQGHTASSGEAVYATPYAGEQQLGSLFRSDLTLAGWLDDNPEASAQLLPIAEADGAGGIVALWRTPDALRVVLIDDLDKVVLAASPLDFLRLVAIGHDEFKSFTVSELPPEESAAAHADFRDWVQSTFSVTVPEAWEDLGGDEFTDWWNEQTGQIGQPLSTTENPDQSAGHTSVAGPITTLLDVLGNKDDEQALTSLATLTGVKLGAKLKSSTRQLTKTGLELSVTRGEIETIWVHIALGRGLYGSAPTEHTWWTRPDLIEGLTRESTMDEARALLGQPEKEGKAHLRYRVGAKFLHLSFGEANQLSQITLMTKVP